MMPTMAAAAEAEIERSKALGCEGLLSRCPVVVGSAVDRPCANRQCRRLSKVPKREMEEDSSDDRDGSSSSSSSSSDSDASTVIQFDPMQDSNIFSCRAEGINGARS